MARGGKRVGTGGPKPNRTDLASAGRPVAVQSPTGQTYGDRARLEQAQHTMPMASQPAIPAAPPGPPPAGPPGGMAPPPQPGLPPPDPSQHMLAPTGRPNEPVTAGIPSGPGPGPEALGPLAQASWSNAGQLLAQLAQMPGAGQAIRQLASFARSQTPQSTRLGTPTPQGPQPGQPPRLPQGTTPAAAATGAGGGVPLGGQLP